LAAEIRDAYGNSGLPPDQLRVIESGNAMGLMPRLKA